MPKNKNLEGFIKSVYPLIHPARIIFSWAYGSVTMRYQLYQGICCMWHICMPKKKNLEGGIKWHLDSDDVLGTLYTEVSFVYLFSHLKRSLLYISFHIYRGLFCVYQVIHRLRRSSGCFVYDVVVIDTSSRLLQIVGLFCSITTIL